MKDVQRLDPSESGRGTHCLGKAPDFSLVLGGRCTSCCGERICHQMDEPPGALSQLLQSTGVPIDRYSFETIEIMKDREEIDGWRRELMILRARLSGKTDAEAEASIPLPRLTVHTMDVSFDAIKDSVERVRFMNMPTSFVLPPEDVDRLREIGARLLRGSHDFQDLLREWSGTATP